MFRQYDEESEYVNALQPASVSAIIRRTARTGVYVSSSRYIDTARAYRL